MIDASLLPHSPGCYIYKDSKDRVIYVGKAKDLRKRVASYFQKKDHDPKTAVLVANTVSIDYIATDNEVEALILENNLIKKHQPKYNINLKDSKRYAYLDVTSEEFPRIVIARKRGDNSFGPFVSAAERDHVREVLVKSFRIRTCRRMPKRACLRYHIGLCPAPCVGLISKKEYGDRIKDAVLVLKGRISDVVDKLSLDMEKLSKNMDFEKAIIVREQINALMHLKERQKMEREKRFDEDIINYMVKEGTVYLILFNIEKGMLLYKHEFVFSFYPDFLSDFLTQYYSENPVPKEVMVPEPVSPVIAEYLSKIGSKKVSVFVPLKGEKKELLSLVEKNVELSFFGDIRKVTELQKALRLNDLPKVIEVFDISHISGTSTVGSMVQFRNGKPDKSNYRRFKVRVVGIDDYASIAEVVRRRYFRCQKEGVFPDLVVIDGGKGQLSAALESLKTLGVSLPVISLAKRLEEVYVPGLSSPLVLDRKGTALKFLQEMRDEAHRFAISYNRLLRKKEMVGD